MRANRKSPSLGLCGLFILCVASTVSTATAQPAPVIDPGLANALSPGATVWITDAGGAEQKMRIVGLSGDTITATVGEAVRRIRTTEVKRVRARHSDSFINGALIGAGAAIATGLGMCTLTEPWENCRDDVGPMLGIGALGAGIGIGIDALIRGRTTLYEAPRGSTRLEVTPLVTRRAAGLRISVSF